MRLVLLSLAACACAAALSAAQAAAPTKRYLAWAEGEIGGFDARLDAVLEETSVNGRTVAAKLDVCLPAAVTSRKLDHFTAALTVKGDTLTAASATSDKLPTSIVISRTVAGDQVKLTATIKRGDIEVETNDETIAYLEDDPVADTSPAHDDSSEDDATNSANALAVTLDPARALVVLEALRKEPVRIDSSQIYPTCDDLRLGKETWDVTVAPERAEAITRLLKSLPGVLDVRRGSGDMSKTSAIRFTAPPELAERTAIVRKAADVIARSLGGTVAAVTADEPSGEYHVFLKKRFDLATDQAISQQTELRLLIEQDKNEPQVTTLYVAYEKTTVALDGQDTQLELANPEPMMEDPAEQAPSLDRTVADLAQDFGGTTWDSENSKWK